TRSPGTTTQPDREKVTLQTVFSAPAMFTIQAISGTTVGASAFDPKACTMPRTGTTTQPGGGNHPQTVLNRPSNTRHLRSAPVRLSTPLARVPGTPQRSRCRSAFPIGSTPPQAGTDALFGPPAPRSMPPSPPSLS